MPDVQSGFQIVHKYFRTSMGVAGGVVMIERYIVVAAEIVKPMVHSRQQLSSHLHRADVAEVRTPFDAVMPQAFLKNGCIKQRIVGYQKAAGQ